MIRDATTKAQTYVISRHSKHKSDTGQLRAWSTTPSLCIQLSTHFAQTDENGKDKKLSAAIMSPTGHPNYIAKCFLWGCVTGSKACFGGFLSCKRVSRESRCQIGFMLRMWEAFRFWGWNSERLITKERRKNYFLRLFEWLKIYDLEDTWSRIILYGRTQAFTSPKPPFAKIKWKEKGYGRKMWESHVWVNNFYLAAPDSWICSRSPLSNRKNICR